MKKKQLKPEGVKSILLIRPHFISIEDMLKVSRELKSQFAFAKITFTGSKENLTDFEISTLKSSPEISEMIIYDKEKISQFKYIWQLRRKKFYLSVIPSIPWPIGTYRKTKISALLFGTKGILLYDLAQEKGRSISEKNIVKGTFIDGHGLIEEGIANQVRLIREMVIKTLFLPPLLITSTLFLIYTIWRYKRKNTFRLLIKILGGKLD